MPKDQIHFHYSVLDHHWCFFLYHLPSPGSFHCLVPYHTYFHLSIVLDPDLVDLGPFTDLCHLSLIFQRGNVLLSLRAQWSVQETLLAQCSWDTGN